MAYNKKNWQDNVSDITAAELNRMEQGIYDNSLVVDAVTNTINPTDTETYKTAELTEGQITDVIGVNDIIIKGQTSQNGTPTPSSPVDVNVVSGSNVINTSNKNLFNPTYTFSEKGVTSVIINQQIKWNGTSSGRQTYKMADINMPIGTYKITLDVISGTHDNSKHIWLDFYNNNTKVANNNWSTSGIRTNTLNSSVNAIYLGFDPADTFNNFTFRMQIEKDTATTYEPHQGKELPLDFGSTELCKIGNYQDYFYKSGSKWYLHKEIGKVILDGSESWGKAGDINNHNRYSVALSTGANNATLLCYSNYFKGVTRSGLVNANEIAVTNYINILIDNITTDTDFKTWLASNNITLYYILATPTDTEITDTEITGTLKEQLEAIYNAPLYEQTNITQTNNDLPMVLDITACKDNINGIKAFIRK